METWNLLSREILSFWNQVEYYLAVTPLPLLIILFAPTIFIAYVFYQGIKQDGLIINDRKKFKKILDFSEDKNIPIFSHVLIVDDDEDFLCVFEDLLSNKGISVIKAKNGNEAYEILKEDSYHRIDVVCCDIHMPELDGLALCVKNKGLYPFLLVSGGTDLRVDSQVLNLADGYIDKEVIHDDILEAITNSMNTWIQKKKKAA